MKRKILMPMLAMLTAIPVFLTAPSAHAASNVFVLSNGSVYDGSASQNVAILGVAQSNTDSVATYNMYVPATPSGNTNVIVLSSNNACDIVYPSAIQPDAVKTKYDITIMDNGVIFDGGYYAAANPDVVAALGTSHKALINHYYEYGCKEGRLPNAGMTGSVTNVLKYKVNGTTYYYAPTDAAYFTQGRIDAISAALTKFYKAHPAVVAPETSFDYIAYANKYDDLKKAFGYDKTALYNHYITYGIAEGRTIY